MLAIDHYSALHADSDVDAVVMDIHNTAIQDHDDDEPGVEWEADLKHRKLILEYSGFPEGHSDGLNKYH